MNRIICSTLVLISSFLCLPVYAQDQHISNAERPNRSAVAPAPAVALSPEIEELRRLVGTWSTHEVLEPSAQLPVGATYVGTVRISPGPGGSSIVLDHHSEGALGSYAAQGMIGWNPAEKVYRLAWADSTAPGITFESGSKDGAALVFRGEGTLMGRKIAIREVIDEITPDSFTLTIYGDAGAGEKKRMTIRYTRAPSDKHATQASQSAPETAEWD